MNNFKLLFSKNYWKYIFSIKTFRSSLLSIFGIIWLIVEAVSFFSVEVSNYFKSHWHSLTVIGLLILIYENWPKSNFKFIIKDRDINVHLSIGDIFSYEGDIVVPSNTSFDTSFENDLISKNSIQGQFTLKYFPVNTNLAKIIKDELDGIEYSKILSEKVKGNKFCYEIGNIVKLKLHEGKYAYMLAMADMNNEGVASTTFDNVLSSLASLWNFISTKGEDGIVNIPVLGTGRGRLKEDRTSVIKAIIHSFISASILDNRFCKTINIVINPSDFNEFKIDIKDLCDFTKFLCENHHYTNPNIGSGKSL